MSNGQPDYSEIVEGLFIGNLASATTFSDIPEDRFSHVLSVCHEYPESNCCEKLDEAGPSSKPTLAHPRHHRIAVHDHECEALLPHLPSAVAFIKDALDTPSVLGEDETCRQELGTEAASKKSHARVLVHCVMGISRSVTVVCAYLMTTRNLSPSAALRFIQRRRPQAQPNFGFRRQLAIFGEQSYFLGHPAPVTSNPLYASWMRKCNREAKRFLARLDNIVEIKLGEKGKGRLSMTDDFPTDPVEAATLLAELEITHFLSVSPACMPALPPSPPSASVSSPISPVASVGNSPHLRPEQEAHTRSLLQHACLQLLPLTPLHGLNSDIAPAQRPAGSPVHSPLSSRSSSFSGASAFTSGLVSPSTAATSVFSLPGSLSIPSKLRLEASSESEVEEGEEHEEEEEEEPTFLGLARARHYHLPIPSSGLDEMSDKMAEGALFVHRALVEDEYAEFPDESYTEQRESGRRGYPNTLAAGDKESESKERRVVDPNGCLTIDDRKPHVLVYSTTESRACAVICAYFMAAWGAPPAEAFDFLKEDQPLFNPTKGFMAQLEHFHKSDRRNCAATSISDSSLVNGSGCTGDNDQALDDDDECDDLDAALSTAASKRRRGSHSSPLLRRLGTPARCGSFATNVKPTIAPPSPLTPVSHSVNNNTSHVMSSPTSDWGSLPRKPASGSRSDPRNSSGSSTNNGRKESESTSGRLDDAQLEALLRRCEGSGAPGFAFDVEAFRGALRAVESRELERRR